MPSQLGWIWPKDPRPGNPQHWPRRWRIFDVLTSKGPDIYVGRIDQPRTKTRRAYPTGPTRQGWSRWEFPNDPEPDYSPLPWARRPAGERYDFRTRKYHVPDHGTWSDVEYCNGRRARRGNGAGEMRRIVYRGDIGIGRGMSIQRISGMIPFMAITGIEGNTQVGKMWLKEKKRDEYGVMGG
ncbi:hypothetical protein N7516_011436 [Penicillium verrucosum]|uniref:uncharacterized protein n=1 Tax=Penicillium verrucosum TaxID=60171 RepID=UPI002544E8F5|nr:uncharacterized protein N7516_011436 [Penicillium verrucosum]KAJ5920578.1 hypothetical protein N7516_011436 [Penicillium verrucosum]